MTNWRHSPQHQTQRYEITQKDLAQFADSLRSRRQDPKSLYRQAIFLQRKGKHKLALELLEEAILADLAYVKAYNAMGVSYDYLRDYPRAIEAYKRALKLNPDLAYVQNNLGYSYLLQGDFDSAIDAFKAAVALDYQSAKYHNNLALAYAQKGLYDLTLAEFKIAGSDEKAQYNMSQIYARVGDYSKAKNDIATASKIDTVNRTTKADLPKANARADIANIQQDAQPCKNSINDRERIESDPAREKLSINDNAENPAGGTDEKYEIAYDSYTVVEERPRSGSNLVPLEEEIRPISGISELYLDQKENEALVDESLEDSPEFFLGSIIAVSESVERQGESKPKNETTQAGYSDLLDDKYARNQKNQELKEIAKGTEINGHRSSAQVEIEVSNGVAVNGMAGKVGAYLKERGFNVTRLTKANYFGHKETKIFYDSGQLQDAYHLLDEIPIQSKIENLIEMHKLENKIRLLIGKDMLPYEGVIVKPKDKGSPYPYSIQLSSCRARESAFEVLCKYQKDGLIPYVVQEDLGDGEVWWRVFVGHYKTRKEALRAQKEYDLSDSIVKKTTYTNLINIFSSEIEAKDNLSHLQDLGYSPYIVRSDEKMFRVVEGAFVTRQRAIKHQLALQSKGIQNQVVKR